MSCCCHNYTAVVMALVVEPYHVEHVDLAAESPEPVDTEVDLVGKAV